MAPLGFQQGIRITSELGDVEKFLFNRKGRKEFTQSSQSPDSYRDEL